MNREAKVGLLVALAFVLVLAILLSENASSAQRPGYAALADAAEHGALALATPAGVPLKTELSGLTHVPAPASSVPSRATLDLPPNVVERAPEVPSVAVREHVAQKGDTVTRLAARYAGGDVGQIVALNPGLDRVPLQAGLAYRVPAGSVIEVVEPLKKSPASHVVRPNDSLWKIAKEKLGTPAAVGELRDLNRDVLGPGDQLKVGSTLKLPERPS